ncbi:hypothetical protein KIN20_004537 [Parelaphostrongylus tenuis]|uniref:Regulator of G-protein signaling 7 n=1 Tax=Parelaphostrongylus tenuis TaxID=148309 RepID=A0AAD5M1V5_PARTN|nr:hypothetical protein KIN20_004537 [Parelaphostrongylus tenuis]
MSCTIPLAKLDILTRRLQESVQLRTHKYFRVAVPQALTGQSLVALVGEKGCAEDEAEAVHLATLLLQHGYLFPVIEPALTVRDDGTLYRLQRPYFWPSHATQTDNVEYAIYLNKRLLRNEQKHGLEEDEAESYNRFAELLGHMWGFITQQAEMQLKQQKEKKKADKVVYDSEERAFWRLRRPCHPDFLEQPVQKVDRRIRKATVQSYRNLVDRLKFSLKTKPWLKALKASDTMVQWVDQRVDYDPFLTAPQPSNPWITDDTNLWTLNTDTVEVPTERRVKRWGLSVQELVKDPIGRQVLETFLESEFSSENIRFWIAIQDLKYSPNEQIDHKTERIYEEFLAPGAPAQVNVDSRTLDQTLECLQKATTASARRHAFTHSEEHVFTLMAKDSYPRFVRSQIYKGVLSAAQQQGSRRLGWRNFIFNMGAAKKPQSKPVVKRDELQSTNLPKQLSSDSLPIRTGHANRSETTAE